MTIGNRSKVYDDARAIRRLNIAVNAANVWIAQAFTPALVFVAHQNLIEVAGGVFVVRKNNHLLPTQIGFKQRFELLEFGVVREMNVSDVVPDFSQRINVFLQGAVNT